MVKDISKKLSLPYFDILGTDKSHLVPGKISGNAILSRYPITSSDHFMIKSPGIEVDRPNGDHWVLHNKGAQTVTIDIEGHAVALTNLQYFPFHHFNRTMNDPEFAPERQQLVDHLTKMGGNALSLVTGDFNNKGLKLQEAFPELFEQGFVEALETGSTVVGDEQQLDHILFRPGDVTATNAGLMTIPSDHLALHVTLDFIDDSATVLLPSPAQ